MKLELHSSLEDFDALSADERESLKRSLKKNGCKHPLLVWADNGHDWLMDGRHRYEICNELAIPFSVVRFDGTEEEAKSLAMSLNEDRRHRTPEQRRERISRVASARREGKSLRTIAKEENVSLTQIQRDVEDIPAGVPGGTPEPEKVIGKDKKEYPPTKPPLPLCDRCQRTGPVKGCSMCAELRQTSKPKKPQPKPKPDDTAVDAYGNPIPANRRHAFQDPWIQETIDWLATASATFWGKRMADGITKRKKYLPFFNVKDFVDGCGMAGNTIDQLLSHLKEFRPAGVCPACEGVGCAECKLCGMVPRDVYAKLKGKK